MEKKSYLTIVLIAIVFFVLGGVVVYFLNKNELDISGGNKLNVYGIKSHSNNHSIYACTTKNLHCLDVVLTIDTETDNAVILDVGGDDVTYGIQSSKDVFSYVLYVDNGLKLYDINSKKINKIDMGLSDKEIVNYFDNGYLLNGGFIYKNYEENEHYYYDLKNNKKLFDEYEELYLIYYYGSNEKNDSYLYASNNGFSYVLDIKGNKVVFKEKRNAPGTMVNVFNTPCEENLFFVMYDYELMDRFNKIVYNDKGNEIIKLNDDEEIFIPVCQSYDGKTAFSIYKNTNLRNYNENGILVK